MIFRLSPRAVQVLVDAPWRAAGEVGDDEACVGALRPGLDPGDDALDPAPAAGPIPELLVVAQLAAARRGGVPRSGALLQRRDVPVEGGGRGDAEHEVEPLGAADVEDLRRAVMAVRADQDFDLGPVATDLAHQPAQEGAGLGTGRTLGRAQHGGHGPALAIEDHDGLEAILVIVGVEEPQLLPAVDGIEGVVDVEHDAAGHLPEAGAVQPDHGAGHPQQGAHIRQVLQPRDGRLRAERRALGQRVEGELEDRVVPQAVGVVAILVACRDHQHAEAQDGSEVMPDPLRRARVVDAGRQAVGDTEPALDLAQGQQAAVGGELPAIEPGDQRLAANR